MPDYGVQLFNTVYFALQIAFMSVVIGDGLPSPNMVIISGVFSPFAQLAMVFHMAWVQRSFKNKLTFSNFNFEVYPGVSL